MSDRTLPLVVALVVGAGRGTRRLDNTRGAPPALQALPSGRTVLDWVLQALSSRGISRVTYVGGYHIEKVIERYPDLGYRFHRNWAREGELAALKLGWPEAPADCLVIRATTVCVPDAVASMLEASGELAAGYYAAACGQKFAGLVAVPSRLAATAGAVADRLSRKAAGATMEDWLAAMAEQGFPAQVVDLDSFAAPVSDAAAVARTVFGGKGRTLERVGPLVASAVVLAQVRFRVDEWRRDAARVIAKIQHAFGERRIVVRSSAHAEDGFEESLAGRFRSVLDVPASHADSLRAAVDEVIGSYRANGRAADPRDEVLVQPLAVGLAASGVLLTRDPETGAPYYILNIDRCSGRSDVVTSGAEVSFDTLYISHTAKLAALAPDVGACLKLARELEDLTHLHALDVEFGIARSGTLYLFQTRPIGKVARRFELADEDLFEELERMREFLDSRFRPHPMLAGETTVLGTMPDWNPAEMIGNSPRPLALSLYQDLIGDSAWATARALMGYRDVRPEPLIVSLAGRPYVDVRASLNSFLPAGIEDAIAERWVNHCLRTLSDDPRLHDKIEFEVAITCFAFDFEHQARRLQRAGLSASDIATFRARLLALTDGLLTGRVAPLEGQLAAVEELDRRRRRWAQAPAARWSTLAQAINALLVDCQRFGTVPFSVLARYAFIAMSLVRSLERVAIFSPQECEALLSSIPTVASDLSRDLAGYGASALSLETLLDRYGHLRPSSYDITSANYRSAWEIYLKQNGKSNGARPYPDAAVAVDIFRAHASEIESLLRSAGFSASYEQLRDFVLRSIPAREWAKFVFMRSVDSVLEGIAALGEAEGFSRDEMSYVPIELLARCATNSASAALKMEFRRSIEFHRKRWNLTCAIRLPHLLRSVGDVDAFQLAEWTPNFVSNRRVVASPAVLEGGAAPDPLEGRIVLIRAADPGYDWIFGQPIAGLITQYGGVASHMAIRAAEFGLPAAIGCGEIIFERLRQARLIELDCASKRVRAVA